MKIKLFLILCIVTFTLSTGIGFVVAGSFSIRNPGKGFDSNYGYTPRDREESNFLELVDSRTKNSKKYQDQNDPNIYAIDSYIGDIHYKDDPADELEQWKDINTTLVSAEAPWDYQMLQAGYHIRLLEDFTAGQIIEFEKQNEYVRFQPMALNYTNDLGQIQQISMPETPSSVDVVDNKITWYDAYGEGLDFSWECGNTRLLKLLSIDSFLRLPSIAQYVIDGGNPVIELTIIFAPSSNLDCYVDGGLWDKKTKTSIFDTIEWRLGDEVLFGFMPNWFWDADGDYPEIPAKTTLSKSGSSFYLSIDVPYDWIETAVYPIYIDTTVDEQVGDSADDVRFNRDSSVWQLEANTSNGAGYANISYYKMGCANRFNGLTISNGDTIDTAYLTFKSSGNYSSTTVNTVIIGEDVDNASQISDTADYQARRGTVVGGANNNYITTAVVSWNNIGSWTTGTEYSSPEIKSVIQEIIDREGWVSNNALNIFWDDHGANGTQSDGVWRKADSIDVGSSGAKLHIEYTADGEAYQPRSGVAIIPGSPMF